MSFEIPADKGWAKLNENAKDAYHMLRRLSLLREGVIIGLVEGYRSPERQEWLYSQGRTRPGSIVTNAKPGHSKHETGHAFDIKIENASDKNPFNVDMLGRVGAIGLTIGLKWGIVVKGGGLDMPHFEVPTEYGTNGLAGELT